MASPSRKAGSRIRVLLPLPLAEAYDYRLPAELHAAPGSFVEVPLGGRVVPGCVWDPEEGAEPVAEARLREVIAVKPAPPMPPALRRLVDWVAAYTLSPRGAVLRMAMSVPAALDAPAAVAGWRAVTPVPEGVRITPERARALMELGAATLTGAELARRAAVAPGVLRGLARAGLIAPARLPGPSPFAPPDPDHAPR